MSSQRPRESAAEPPYTGPLGVTRRESASVPSPDGSPRRIEVVRQVNVLTDPLLARQALDGTLHRVQELELAVPFLFHDPSARRFALVVPAARAHEELRLRAELLQRLADDASEVLPGYVREARAVVGPGGLRRYLEESSRSPDKTDPRIEATQRAVSEREERVHRLAAELSRREDELVSAQNDLARREQELDRRLGEVIHREDRVASDEMAMRASVAALQAREQRLRTREEARANDTARQPDMADELAESLPRRDSQIIESEALTARPPAPGESAVDVLDADDVEPLREPGERTSGEVEVGDDRMEVELDDLAPLRNTSPGERARPSVEQVEILADASSVSPPEARAAQSLRDDRAYVAAVEGEVRVWFQGTLDVAQQIAGGTVVPVLQADPEAQLPLAVLTLRGDGGSPVYTRVALDITRPEDRAVVESLARDFRVRAEVVSPLGRPLGGAALAAPCEANAQRILELLTARDSASADDHLAAMVALARDGVRWSPGDAVTVSFSEDQALATASAVEAALRGYEPLLDRDFAAQFSIARGVARAQVESFAKRLCLAALRCGVAPSAGLVKRALELGIAPDERALATRALTAYARTVEGGVTSIGRSASDASAAWTPLLAWATRVGVAIPDAARAAIATLYDPDDVRSVAPPDTRTAPAADRFATMGDGELITWIDHPDARLPAARELARRDAAKHEAAIGRALRMLPGPQAAQLAADLVRGGDALGDVWVEMLGSKRRVVAALGTAGAGTLKLRRALNPLVQRALAKDNPAWKLAAWATGEFGVAAVRALQRVETDQTERLAWMLGHAIRCGAAREVERTRAESTRVFQDAATRALALQDEIRAWHESLRRGEGELERLVAPLITRATDSDGSPHDGAGSL